MTKIKRIQNILKQQKPLLESKYNVKNIGIFGPYVRNDFNRKGDLDILVDFSEIPGLFEFVEIEQYLSDKIGIKVDLIMKSALKPPLKQYILKEVRYICDQKGLLLQSFCKTCSWYPNPI